MQVAVGVSGSQKGDNFQVKDCVFIGPFDISTLSQYILFSFLPHLRIRPCFVFGQNATFLITRLIIESAWYSGYDDL